MKTLFPLLIILFFTYAKAFGDTHTSALKAHCLDEKQRQYSDQISSGNQSLRGVFILLKDESNKQYMFDCSYFKIGPITEEFYQKECLPEMADSKVKELDKIATELEQKLQCDKSKTSLLSAQCLKEVSCNLIRSDSWRDDLAYMIAKHKPMPDKSCAGSGQSDCMNEIVTGVIKNIWGNVMSIGYLAKWTYDGAASFFSSDKVAEVEKKTSESLHAASNAEDSFLDQFLRNPALAVRNAGISIYKMLSQLVADHFACGKWSGIPHISKCLQPLNDWDCSSCDQKLNALCGVGGFLSGEIVTAFLTGASINVLGKAGKVAKIGKIVKGVKSSSPSLLGDIASYYGSRALSKALYYPLKTIALLHKVPGIGAYLKATDDAFMLGLKGPNAYYALKLQKAINHDSGTILIKQKELSSLEGSPAAAPKVDLEVNSLRKRLFGRGSSNYLSHSQLDYSDMVKLKGRITDPLEEILKSGTIVEKKFLGGGVNKSYIVTFEDGTKAVWKPHFEEWTSNYRTEVLAYEVDRKFGFNIVPVTVERVIDGKKGSMQLFKKSVDTTSPLTHRSRNKQTFFDFIIENNDRGPGNFLYAPDGNIISIDNGASFTGKGRSKQSFELIESDINNFLKTDEGSEVMKKFKSLDFKSFKEETQAYLGGEDAELLIDRIKKAIDHYDKLKAAN